MLKCGQSSKVDIKGHGIHWSESMDQSLSISLIQKDHIGNIIIYHAPQLTMDITTSLLYSNQVQKPSLKYVLYPNTVKCGLMYVVYFSCNEGTYSF